MVRESVRLALVALVEHIAPRQRAVLILREVLRWPAADVAEVLGTTVVSVNSALQRARANLAAADLGAQARDADTVCSGTGELGARYIDAFDRSDFVGLLAVLCED